MGINLVRIDDRLIHGQVVEGWMRVIKADTIIIVSDKLADKEEEKILFSLALPKGVDVICLRVSEAAVFLKKKKYTSKDVLMLTEGPQEIVTLLRLGVAFESINVGGMHYAPGKISINDSLYVDKTDCEMFEEISSFKVDIEARALPGDKRLDVLAEIKKLNL
jgi:mannose/fructose/N-acetylgalactosamine-specific phosphotransferase system component IIB